MPYHTAHLATASQYPLLIGATAKSITFLGRFLARTCRKVSDQCRSASIGHFLIRNKSHFDPANALKLCLYQIILWPYSPKIRPSILQIPYVLKIEYLYISYEKYPAR